MRIEAIDYVQFAPRFEGDGYAISFMTQKTLSSGLLRLTLENGQTGIGESVRPALRQPDDPDTRDQAEADVLRALRGVRLSAIPSEVQRLQDGPVFFRPLAFALDTAFYDLVGKSVGVPVSVLLGGPESGSVAAYLSISSGPPEDMAQRAGTEGRDFPIIQVKLGAGDIERDLYRVKAILDSILPDQRLLADFNGALTPEVAIEMLGRLGDARITWEEPCQTYDQNLKVARALRSPVIFDQCLETPAIYLRLVADGATAAVLKPALVGGLSRARTLRDLLAASGIAARIDGPWSGQIGAAAALHVALGMSDGLMMGSIDLTGPLETARDMIVRPEPGRVGPAPGPGLGPIADSFFASQAGQVAL